MRSFRFVGVVVVALALASGCTTRETAKGRGSAAAPAPEIAALDAALRRESDQTRIPELLFQRGHAYLDAAESSRDRRGEKSADGRPSTEFARLMLGALRDFEAVVNEYPASADAPEALYHLGVAYDYPNLTTPVVAATYYQRTIDTYPGTQSAEKARVSLERLESLMRAVHEGQHGKQ